MHFLLIGCLTYYDYQETFYTDYKDSLGVINLSDIVQVNSSQLAKCKNTGFDVHAHSHRGERDDRGVRVYTFNAHIDSLCVQWMTAIVENIGGLKLKQISRPGDDSVFYVSVRLDHNSARIMSARGSALIDLSSPRSVAVSNPNPNPVSDKVDSNTISSSTTSTTAPSTVTGSVPAHLRLSQMFPAGSSPGKPSPVLRTTTTTMTAVVTMTRNSSSCPFLTTVKENQTRSVSGANSPSSRPNSAASRSHSTQSLLLQSSNHGTVLADEANILQKLTDDQS